PAALPVAHEPMLLVAVTELVATSAASVYFTAGALRRNITGSMVGTGRLRSWGRAVPRACPQLQERYPDQPMELRLWARRQPWVSCRPDALHGTMAGAAEAFVVLPNATRVPAFLLDIWPRWGHNGVARGVPVLCIPPGAGGWGGCDPRAGLRGACPQVQRLETLLKFGLWLFGVPWANSECCPHPVP
ncbi:BPI protein, partial [Syrrhaptes paradoxus]|nr:BPI protein [Syrrhaptes paradoxus]